MDKKAHAKLCHHWSHFEKPRKQRKPSLTQTIKQVRKAGVNAGTIIVGDVKLEFGSETTTKPNGHETADELRQLI